MSNTISSFTQVIPSLTPVQPDAAATLAFVALLDAITENDVFAGPQIGMPDVPGKGPEASTLAEGKSYADEDTGVLITDVAHELAAVGQLNLLIIAPPVQSGLPPPTNQQGLHINQQGLHIADSGLLMPDTKPLSPVYADGTAAGSPVPGQPADQNQKTMNAPLADDLASISSHRSGAALATPAGKDSWPAGVEGSSAAQQNKAVPPAPAPAQPAVPETPHWPVQNTDLAHTQKTGVVASDAPQLVKSSPPSFSSLPAILALSDIPNPERPDSGAPVKSTKRNQLDKPVLIRSAAPPTLAAVLMRPTSDTALFGFQMRVRDIAQAAAVTAADDVLKVSPQPLVPLQVPQGSMPTVAARPPLETVGEPLAKSPAEDGLTAEITNTVLVSELSMRQAPVVPPQRPDTAMPPTGLRDLPQTVALALRVDPAQPVSLQIDPIELGTVAFNMDTGPAGLVVTIIAERPETLELLRRNAEQFLADLRQSGFQGASLQFGQSGTSGQDQQRQESAPQHASGPPPTTAPLFETSASKPPPRAGSGLDMRL